MPVGAPDGTAGADASPEVAAAEAGPARTPRTPDRPASGPGTGRTPDSPMPGRAADRCRVRARTVSS